MSLWPGEHVEWIDTTRGPDTPESVEVLDGRDRGLFLRLAWTVVLIAALVAAGVWYAARPKPRGPLTFSGDRISNSSDVLTQASALFTTFARVHGGAISPHGGCFFNRVGGHAKSDVGLDLYCGPVLFYLGKVPAMYLRYPLSPAQPAANGKVLLSVGLQPVSEVAVALPSSAHLERPDGIKPPNGADGVIAPGPPPSPTDEVVQVAASDVPGMTPARSSATLTSLSISVELIASGYLPHYGHGAAERTPAAGYRLLAFEIHIRSGELGPVGSAEEVPELRVVAAGADPTTIPLDIKQDADGNLDSLEYLVASVPVASATATLEVADNGIDQTMSLLDGTMGPNNIAILRRPPEDRAVEVGGAGFVDVVRAWHGSTHSETLPIGIDGAYLGYFGLDQTTHASGPDRALLSLSTCSTYFELSDVVATEPDECDTISPKLFSLTLPDKTVTTMREYGDGNYAFEVPASFTSGTVTASGTLHLSDGSTVTITKPWSLKITIP